MRPERELIITKAISEFWKLDKDSQIKHDSSVLTNVARSGWKFVGFLPSFQKHPSAVLKVYFHGNSFDHEIKGINAVNSFPSIGNISTPKVLKVFPEYKAIIKEYIKMRDSRSALRKIRITNRVINWQDLGKWLRNFHDYETSTQQNKNFIKHKIQKSHHQLEIFAQLFSDDQIKSINSIITAADADLRENSLEWVFSHGDFHTGNIQISGRTTYIIDFENTTMTPRGYEVIHFLSCIESTIYFLFRKRMFNWLSKKFLDGYRMEFPPNTLNNYFYLIGKLDMIAHYHKRMNGTKNKLLKIMFSFLIKQTAKTFLTNMLRKPVK